MIVCKYRQEEIDIRIGELLKEHSSLSREVLNDLGFNNPEALFSNKAALEFALNYEFQLGIVMNSNTSDPFPGMPGMPPLTSPNLVLKVSELV